MNAHSSSGQVANIDPPLNFVASKKMAIEDQFDALFEIKKGLVSLKFRMTISDRQDVVDYLVRELSSLASGHFEYLRNWRSKAHLKIIDILRSRNAGGDAIIYLSHAFRWGIHSVCKDIDFAEALLARNSPFEVVLADPSAFSYTTSYVHVGMLQGRWENCSFETTKRQLAKKSLALCHHLNSANDHCKNRGAFIAAQAFAVLGDFDAAVASLLNALQDKHAVKDQKEFLISLVFKTSLPPLPPTLSAALSEGTKSLNPAFWKYLARILPTGEVATRAASVAKHLDRRMCSTAAPETLNTDAEQLLVELVLIGEIDVGTTDAIQKTIIQNLLARPEVTGGLRAALHARACTLYLDAALQDLDAAFVHASEALSLSYSDEMAVALQRILLLAGQQQMRDCLVEERLHSLGHSVAVERALTDVCRGATEVRWITGLVADELSLMQRLAIKCEKEKIGEFALARISTLMIRGECSPNKALKIQAYEKGRNFLSRISSIPALAPLRTNLEAFGFYRQQSELIRSGENGEWIWLDSPGSDRLIIAFADRFSYHVFPSVPSLVRDRKTNVLFLNNPACNWYSDSEVDRIDKLIGSRVLERFPKENVTCYHGSMGGYAAIRFALRHGFNALAVNPQVNLSLWAMDRPSDAERIATIEDRIDLDKLPIEDYENFSLCLLGSLYPTDFLAFQALTSKLSMARNISLILEKFPVPEHEGLVVKAYKQNYVATVEAKARRLTELKRMQKPSEKFRRLDHLSQPATFQAIKDSCDGAWELIARDGIWYLNI